MLRQKVRLAITCAVAAGATAFMALAALQHPVSAFFALTDEVCASRFSPNFVAVCGLTFIPPAFCTSTSRKGSSKVHAQSAGHLTRSLDRLQ